MHSVSSCSVPLTRLHREAQQVGASLLGPCLSVLASEWQWCHLLGGSSAAAVPFSDTGISQLPCQLLTVTFPQHPTVESTLVRRHSTRSRGGGAERSARPGEGPPESLKEGQKGQAQRQLPAGHPVPGETRPGPHKPARPVSGHFIAACFLKVPGRGPAGSCLWQLPAGLSPGMFC